MNAEGIRRQYLDAMGITTWASRYQLPHALETPACEWEEVKAQPVPPSQQLHALLEDAQQAAARRPLPPVADDNADVAFQAPSDSMASSSPQALRSLIGGAAEEADTAQNTPPSMPMSQGGLADADVRHSHQASARNLSAEPLRFILSSCCSDGLCLSLVPGQPGSQEQALLTNLLSVLAVSQSAPAKVQTFSWPPMANAPASEDPLEEAREGLNAFVKGLTRRNGWQLERVLWWGEPHLLPFAELLNINDGRSQTLDLPVWQGGRLDALADSVDAKRTLLPKLLDLRQSLGHQPDD